MWDRRGAAQHLWPQSQFRLSTLADGSLAHHLDVQVGRSLRQMMNPRSRCCCGVAPHSSHPLRDDSCMPSQSFSGTASNAPALHFNTRPRSQAKGTPSHVIVRLATSFRRLPVRVCMVWKSCRHSKSRCVARDGMVSLLVFLASSQITEHLSFFCFALRTLSLAARSWVASWKIISAP